MDGSQNPAAILRGGFVGASIARPQDSAPSRPHPTACGVLPTDPVWARRPKPTRPAETERPPLSFGTPHAMQPQGSWSPDFRNVWSRRREAGLVESRTGCRMVISGRTGGDTSAKSFYFPCGRSKPAATQGLPRGREWASPRRTVPQGFFFLPLLSFSRTKKKEGVRAAYRRRQGRRILARIPTATPIE